MQKQKIRKNMISLDQELMRGFIKKEKSLNALYL